MTITYIRLDKDKIYFNIRNSIKDQYVQFYVNVFIFHTQVYVWWVCG